MPIRRRNLDPEITEEYNALIQRARQSWLDRGYTTEIFWSLYEQNLRTNFEATIDAVEASHAKYLEFVEKNLTWVFSVFMSLCTSIVFVLGAYYLIFHIGFEDYIYPVMNFMRNMVIPIISLFPMVTEYYHKTCMLQNPFFVVSNMDCSPCRSVTIVNEIHNLIPNEHPDTPFIYKTEQVEITFDKLKEFYRNNKHNFDDEAPLILIDGKSFITPSNMISLHDFQEQHTYIWEFNNMKVARLLRQIVPRPKIVPKFGQSIERFIIVDSSQKEFDIPDTECHNSFLLSLSGTRTVVLEPAKECQKKCKSLKIELDPTYVLWYNWWYWKPVILESSGNTTFIAHSGSYCY